jgi:glycogen synthase
MPSFYEPFGAANEFYLNGTLGIGRATGGILQQIVPLRSAASFSAAVEARARRWYDSAADPTGLLYRERDGIESATRDLDAINAAQYDVVGPGDDRVAERGTYQLFREMVEELALALRDGISLWRDRKGEYFRMLADGVRHVERTFSWERSAADLARHLR